MEGPEAATDQQEEEQERGRQREPVVGRPHLRVAQQEGLRHPHEGGDLGKLRSRHRQPEAEVRLADPRLGAQVDEKVVDPLPGAGHLRALHELVGAEIDSPVGLGLRLGDRPGLVRGEGGPGLVLGEPQAEAVGRPGGGEAQGDLADLSFPEMAHLPAVRVVVPLRAEAPERVILARFQLHVRAHPGARVREGGRLADALRTPSLPLGQLPRRLERPLPIHLQVDRRHREGLHEVARGEGDGARDQKGEGDPEDGTAGEAPTGLVVQGCPAP